MDAIVVPCTQEKIWATQPDAGSVPAKDAYTKAVFQTWRTHAEQSGCPWFVLSTRYGLLKPDQPIDQYDVPVSAALRDQTFLNLLRRQGEELGLGQFNRLVLLDWEKFEPLVEAAAGDAPVQCVLRKIAY